MLKTNNKKVKEKIKDYIVKIYDDEDAIDSIQKATNFDQIKENVKKVWYDEVGQYDLKRRIPIFESFKNWCYGLPSLLETGDYLLGNGIKVLGDILEETEEERSKFSVSEAEEKLTYLIFRQIF